MKLVLWTCLLLAPLSAQPAGVIEGRVINSVTGEAVSGVTVRFLDRHGYVHKSATDASGGYRLTNLDDGDYNGEFTKEGFAGGNRNPSLHVSGSAAARQDAQLEPLGAMHGRVIDEDGALAAKIQVQLGFGVEAETDEAGAFVFQNLAPASYTLVARPQPKVRTVDGVRIGAVATFYPSVTDLSQAVPVVVPKGADVSGIEIRLKSVPVHRLSGIVRDPSGKPAAKATVKLMGRAGTARQSLSLSVNLASGRPYNAITTLGPGPEPEIARVETRDDGTFEFPAVESGDWRLTATLGEDDETPLAAVAPALVSARDVEGVDLRLSSSFAVGVTGDWGTTNVPDRAARASLMLSPVEAQPRLILDPAQYPGQIPGIFPGRYRVTPYGSPDFYAASVMWAGRDVNGQVVEIAPGAPPFQVVYSSDAGTLRGTVNNGANATVILTPRDPAELTFIRQEPCAADGAFNFTGVPPGSYYAVAFDRSDTRGLPVSEIPNAIIPIATSIRVESGATASVELRLNRWPW